MLDYAIHVLVITAVVLSLVTGRAFFAASVLFVNIGYNQLIYINDPTWQQATAWCVLFAVKDLLILTLFGFRRSRSEFILLLTFGASCLFHQAILAQILTNESKNLTLFAIRPDFMMYVSVAQLATVFYMILKGGWNGGKRVKSALLAGVNIRHSVLHTQTFKVNP